MRRKGFFVLAASAAALALACTAATGPAAARPAANESARSAYGIAAPVPAPVPGAAPPGDAGGPQSGGGNVLGVRFLTDRVLVLTASLELRALDAWEAADRVQRIALGLGGEVTAVSQSGKDEHRSATVTVRVPNERFQDALDQIKTLKDAEVARVEVKGEDRTEQFIDLEARLKAKTAEEQRYLALLARADKIDDILKIDQVLSNVRAQIEQLTGQLNALKNRSSLATITVSVGPLAVVPEPPKTGWQPALTFQAAAASLLGFLQRLADLAIWAAVWLVPPLFALAIAVALGRFAVYRRPTS